MVTVCMPMKCSLGGFDNPAENQCLASDDELEAFCTLNFSFFSVFCVFHFFFFLLWSLQLKAGREGIQFPLLSISQSFYLSLSHQKVHLSREGCISNAKLLFFFSTPTRALARLFFSRFFAVLRFQKFFCTATNRAISKNLSLSLIFGK